MNDNRKFFAHFFIVGAQRSGTTYLYEILDEHPEVEMAKPLRPEPKFFLKDDLYKKGIDYYEKHFFQNRKGVILRGEKSTSYIESPKAAERISYSFPEAKVIFILRNPIKRAISNYWFSFNNGFESLSMEEAFKGESHRIESYDKSKISVSPFAYLKRGLYVNYIKIYEKYFSRDKMEILIFEDFIGSQKSVKSLFAFLNIDEEYTPKKLKKVINRGNIPDTNLNNELKSYLCKYFLDSNRKLAVEYNIDLSAWENDF